MGGEVARRRFTSYERFGPDWTQGTDFVAEIEG